MNRIIMIMMMMLTLHLKTTIKNSIIGYTTVGDTLSFDKPSIWSFIKDDNSKWMAIFGLMKLNFG